MISEKKYREAMGRLQAARTRLKRVKEESDDAVMQVVQTAEVGASSFGHALIEGYWNGVEFLGIPLPLLTGTGFHVLGFLDVAPEHMHNFGDGAYASYLTTLGLGLGEEMRQKNAQPATPAATQGHQLPPAGATHAGAGLTDAQLAALARMAA